MASTAPLAENNERKANMPLYVGVGLLPYIFVWFLLRKGHSNRERVIGFGWLAFLVCIMMFTNSGSNAGKPASPAEVQSSAPVPAPEPSASKVVEPVAASPDVKPQDQQSAVEPASAELSKAASIVKNQFFPDEKDHSDSASYQKEWWMIKGAVHEGGYPCSAVAFVKQTFHGTFQAVCKILPHTDKFMVFEIDPDAQTVVPIGQ